MSLLLKIASWIFTVSLLVAVVCGLLLIWQEPGAKAEILVRCFGTGLLMMICAGYWIAVCDARARIRRNCDPNSSKSPDA